VTARPYRYQPPRRFRYAPAYRSGKRGGNREMIAGVALAAVVIAGASAKTVAVVRHHAAAKAPGETRTAAHHATAAPVTSGSETAFWRALLADLGAPSSQANLASLDAWLPHEEPWPSLARWNPLDSILPEPGSWNFNTFDGDLHVQSYPDASEGAQADAATLANGNYPQITAALRAGYGVCGYGFAAEFSTWSGGGYTEVC
jgi:hypothetical protein